MRMRVCVAVHWRVCAAMAGGSVTIKGSARQQLQNLGQQNKLMKISFDSQKFFTLWRATATAQFADSLGHLPEGVHIPPSNRLSHFQLSSDASMASKMVASQLQDSLFQLGISGKVAGLTVDGEIKFRYGEASQFWQLLCHRRPTVDVTAKGNGFKTEFTPSISKHVLDDWSEIPFETLSRGRVQKKQAEMLASIDASHNLYKTVECPETAGQIQELREMNSAAYRANQHLAVLQLPVLHEELEHSIRGVTGTAQEHRARIQSEKDLAVFVPKQRKEERGGISPEQGNHGRPGATGSSHLDEQLIEENALRKTRIPDMLEARKKLPIIDLRESLLETLETNQVVVISGGTGSGKTTQIPQYLLDAAIDAGHGSDCKMVCTQPRRIAATSVAKRVADERGEPLGQSVGFAVRMKSEPPRKYGSIEFCTTGVLLRRLQNDKTLEGIKYILIDEVHERDINTDFLLLLMKDVLEARKDLKLILMSATLDAEGFSNYFNNAPLVDIPSAPRFPVEEVYIEDLERVIGKSPQIRQQVNSQLAAEQRYVQLEINKLVVDSPVDKTTLASATEDEDVDARGKDGNDDLEQGLSTDQAEGDGDLKKHAWETSANSQKMYVGISSPSVD